jgi:hypothetical protein
MEKWQDISGYEGLYLASNLGRIRNAINGRILKIWVNQRGYGAVNLHLNKQQKKHYAHRLVFAAFNGFEPETVNHKNGNKLDNRIENLEPMTRLENFDHAIKVLGFTNKGVKHGKAKLTEAQVLEIRAISEQVVETMTIEAISKKYGVSRSAITSILKGVNWRHI